MLAGRYPSEEFGELRARITWDRVTDELRGRPGAQRLAVTSGGTIPDRGLFTVMTPGGADGRGSRVGELDEEMVYESRVGDTFLLGTSSWRVEDITHDRVIVTPAPGQPARMPFWKGESIGRPLELGRAVGAFVREMSALADDDGARPGRGRRAGRVGRRQPARLPARAARGHPARAQRPDDPRRAVPRRAGRLAAGGALPVRRAGQRAVGAGDRGPDAGAARGGGARRGAPTTASCCGCRTRWTTTGAEVVPTAEDVLLDPDEVEQIVVAELGGSSLYASRFRECAARALLLPRRDPKRRTPLWQQRQRAAQLLAVAGRYEQFPVTLEAMRECVQDVYDLPGLRELMTDVAAAQGAGGRGGDAVAVAVRAQPAVRLRRDVPLRGRRAAGRAAGGGAVAGLDAAGRAAGLGGDPGAARPGGGGRGRGSRCSGWRRTGTRATPRARRTCCGSSATCPPPRPRPRGAARSGWPSWRRRGGRSGCGSPARSAGSRSRTRAGCATRSGRRCRSACRRRSPSRCRIRWATCCCATPARTGRSRRPRRGPVRARRRRGVGRAGPAGRGRAAGARRAAAAARGGAEQAATARAPSTATPRCCAGCGGRRWPGCGPRSSRSSSARWAGSCPAWQGVRSPGGRRGRMRRAPVRTTSSGWSSSWPGRRCRPARWSR